MVDMRRFGANAVALVFGCLLAAGVAELAVTLGLSEQVKFPRHVVGAPWGLRFNQPGSVYRQESADVDVWFRIDEQGMRADRDFAYAKPPGVKRIVSLGDSSTIGYEVALEDTFSQVLARELGRRGQRVEVLNAGVSGFGTAEENVYLERELWLLRTKALIDPYEGRELLYWDRFHSHWTTFSHARSGEALAELIERHGLLE